MSNAKKHRIVFLDRDGVLNADDGYPFRTEQAQLLDGVADALQRLAATHILAVITNQSGVARGKFELADVYAFHRCLQRELWNAARVRIDAFYICPHHPDGTVPEWRQACGCRKPGTDLVELALREFAIERDACFFIGDRALDMDCAGRAGISAIQIIKIGELPQEKHPRAAATVTDLVQAANFIMNSPGPASATKTTERRVPL